MEDKRSGEFTSLEGIDPAQVREVLRRLDVLGEAKKWGFVAFGEPNPNGWQYGRWPEPIGCGALNIGYGPERGNFRGCDNKGSACLHCGTCTN